MAFDEELADRVRHAIAPHALISGSRVSEKPMMGALCLMVGEHMACGVVDGFLLVRVGRERHAAALSEPHVRPMQMSGRTMGGFVLVEPEGVARDEDLEAWVARGVAVAVSLPPKSPTRPRPRSRRGGAGEPSSP